MPNEPTNGEYDLSEVDGIDTLKNRIIQAEQKNDYSDRVTAYSKILSDYVSFGNNKIAKHLAIFNMNSATDCPNADSDECQVPWDKCYAHQSEYVYGTPLDYRRRQEYLWDCLDANTFAKAFIELVGRKRNPVTAIRFSEAGDFRHNGDIYKADRIAELLEKEGIDAYTYSASSYLTGWDTVEYLTVNQSNEFRDYGDRIYKAFTGEKPDGFVWCPHDYQKQNGSDDPIKCGDCRLCIDKDGPNVAIPLH